MPIWVLYEQALPGCPVALDAPGIPWASEGSCSGGKQIPTVALRVMGPGAVQLSSTRVVNRSRVGGAAGTLSHSLGTQGAVGGQRTDMRGSQRGHREKRLRKGRGKKKQTKKRKNQEQRKEAGEDEGEGCQALESGPRGSLQASRVFTNEGSKKEKRGLEVQVSVL